MKKVLVLFKNNTDLNLTIKSYLCLKKKFGFNIIPLYIRDITYRTPIRETIVNSGSATELLNEIEDDFILKVKKAFLENGINDELIVRSEVSAETIKTFLKTADLIMLEEGLSLNELFLELLKILYRPLIILRNKPLSFDNISIVSNDGVKINKSVYNFINLFSSSTIENIHVLTWNCDYEKHHLLELLKNKGINGELINFNSKDDTISNFYFALGKSSLVIMGNLSRSFFLEKITNRTGLNLLENIDTPIFIG
ncbi:hypothetical protein [uncultured Cetobacterium sp.]|uniref:hypothetical protein n=1 Tax=uncultured Cetobacterium sp. TaxID=527638 RepID=UPI002621A407|nr:hypothetical protein [uncultured Cetobacterium sp.]